MSNLDDVKEAFAIHREARQVKRNMPAVSDILCRHRRRVRFEGGDIDPAWAESLARSNATREEPQPAWCEMTILDSGEVVAFGGTVWPGAWPELFEIGPVTTRGRESVRARSKGGRHESV